MCVLCVWQEPNAFDDFYNFDVISFVNDVVDGYVTLGPGPLGFIQIEEPCFYNKNLESDSSKNSTYCVQGFIGFKLITLALNM